MRLLVRCERPPGAQLSLFEHHDGWRYQAFVTNTGVGQLAFVDAHHRRPTGDLTRNKTLPPTV